MARGFDRERLPAAGRDGDIEVDGIGGDAVHRTLLAPEASTHDAHLGAVVVLHFRNVGRLHLLVARRSHFERGGQVGPQLEAVHAPGMIAFGHLLVDDAASGRHPLHVARGDDAAVPQAITVFDRPGEHVGDGFDAAMRVPGEAGQVVGRDVVTEVVEQKKGIEVGSASETKCTAQVHARAFKRGLR